MAIDYSKTILFEGTPEIVQLKSENSTLIGLNSILVLSLIMVGTVAAYIYIQEKNEKNVMKDYYKE